MRDEMINNGTDSEEFPPGSYTRGVDSYLLSDPADKGFSINDKKYTTEDYDEDLFEDKEEYVGRSSSFLAAFNIICTVVGSGLLGLPYGLNQSGWIGVPMLIILAIIACYCAVILIKCLNPPNHKRLEEYSDIGFYLLGKKGKILVDSFIHLTLLGVATIFLVLAGQNMVQLINQFPNKNGYVSINWDPITGKYASYITTPVIAFIVWFHVFLKTLHEVGWVSFFNVIVALVLFILVQVEVFANPPEDWKNNVTYRVVNLNQYGLSLAGAFSTFAFSYGAHAVLPSIYKEMKNKNQYNIMISLTFLVILIFYLPMSIVGYGAYGGNYPDDENLPFHTESPIYSNFCPSTCDTPPCCDLFLEWATWICIFLITIHVMMSYAIVINPSERAAERLLKIDDIENTQKQVLFRVLLRTGMVLGTFFFAEIIPDFPDFLNLISSCTNTATSFIFPCTFFLMMYWDKYKKNYLVIGFNVAIIILAFFFGVMGAYNGFIGICCNVFHYGIYPNTHAYCEASSSD
eukprot:TRINITY_DN1404_c0_g1_i1.p1 TRINITY_DN1404_c0_g1~~TRINITY_DN1404_c0_g1_i1.p1  ORF type:complete len:517 (+),score=131.71 TRINITY_DN1404_c0_g1_i1:64-1614(+)